MRATACLLLLLLCGACAGRPASGPHWAAGTPDLEPAVAACVEVFAAVDAAVAQAGVRDAEASAVPGHPHLRADRFLASYRKEELSPTAESAWHRELAELDRQGRIVELRNLPVAQSEALDQRLTGLTGHDLGAAAQLERCRTLLVAHERQDPARLQHLRQAVYVPDHYDRVQQAFGLYPLTSIGVAIGFANWKSENLASFELAWEEIEASGRLIAWRPPADAPQLSRAETAALLAAARGNPLQLPSISTNELAALAASFAPILVIDTAGPADAIGRPRPGDVSRPPGVTAERPLAYVRLARTRFGDQVLAQLVYTFWFDERPARGGFDLLAGPLDGLVWRVTLWPDGTPMLYDSMHPCGCYHLFFPVPPTTRLLTEEDQDLREAALTPTVAPRLAPGTRIVLRVQARTHYLQQVAASDSIRLPAQGAGYGLQVDADVPDLQLRSITTGEPDRPYRSLYDEAGIVQGSQRPERFLLWPMGIRSAGAMRQWGTHATAFVGTRHFDDPDLIQRSFGRPEAKVARHGSVTHGD